MLFDYVYFWTVKDSDAGVGQKLQKKARRCGGIKLDETLYGFEGSGHREFETKLVSCFESLEKVGRLEGYSDEELGLQVQERKLVETKKGLSWVS